MILSRKAILSAMEQGALEIDPFDPDQVDAAHIDLHLSLPGRRPDLLLVPGGFMLAQTTETITLNGEQMGGFVDGRASLARLGVSVEQSSHFVEPGSSNPMTLEISNAARHPYTLNEGQPIAKLVLFRLTDTF